MMQTTIIVCCRHKHLQHGLLNPSNVILCLKVRSPSFAMIGVNLFIFRIHELLLEKIFIIVPTVIFSGDLIYSLVDKIKKVLIWAAKLVWYKSNESLTKTCYCVYWKIVLKFSGKISLNQQQILKVEPENVHASWIFVLLSAIYQHYSCFIF